MLLLVFITEYLAGEAAYELFDGYYGYVDLNVIYYIVVSLIDAAICRYVLGTDNKTYFYYAIISLCLVFIHIIGLFVYLSGVNPAFYNAVILIAFMAKLILAVTPNGHDSQHSLYNIWRSLVYRCYYAFASRICWVCL